MYFRGSGRSRRNAPVTANPRKLDRRSYLEGGHHVTDSRWPVSRSRGREGIHRGAPPPPFGVRRFGRGRHTRRTSPRLRPGQSPDRMAAGGAEALPAASSRADYRPVISIEGEAMRTVFTHTRLRRHVYTAHLTHIAVDLCCACSCIRGDRAWDELERWSDAYKDVMEAVSDTTFANKDLGLQSAGPIRAAQEASRTSAGLR